MKIDLSGKRALICGASQGIGEATAKALSAAGAEVILLARDEGKLEVVKKSLPGPAQVVVADLGKTAELEKKLRAHLPIHILVNNAGGPKSGKLMDSTEEDFLTAFQNHVLASQELAKLVLPGMKAANYGRIINLISTSVKAPIQNLGVSNTIRAAMANWAKTLSMEVGSFGVTVNNVLPGFTKTDRLKSLAKATAERMKISVEEVEAQWKEVTPLKRFAEPHEVADGIVFLASPQAAFISGINLPIDGGRTPNL